jgi:hypothetical protein
MENKNRAINQQKSLINRPVYRISILINYTAVRLIFALMN